MRYLEEMRLILLAITFIVASFAGDLRVGRAAVKITPPAGMPMAGYYYVRLNEGVHDDLHAKAVVLEKDGVKAALVALDMANIPRRFVDAARAEVGKISGVPGANVMISATHSHTGPEMGSRLRGITPETQKIVTEYYAELPKRIAESVRLAEADLQPGAAAHDPRPRELGEFHPPLLHDRRHGGLEPGQAQSQDRTPRRLHRSGSAHRRLRKRGR